MTTNNLDRRDKSKSRPWDALKNHLLRQPESIQELYKTVNNHKYRRAINAGSLYDMFHVSAHGPGSRENKRDAKRVALYKMLAILDEIEERVM